MTNVERFKANIRNIEFELHSYCNRKCWFCPNSKIDRTGPAKYLNCEVYSQVLRDLGGIDYDEAIAFAGWCEPYAKAEFAIDRVAEAHAIVPKAHIFSNTNTDFITPEIIDRLAEAGLGVLKLQLYFGEDEEFSYDLTVQKLNGLKKKLPDINFIEKVKGKWFAFHKDLILMTYAKDFRKVGTNRCDMPVRPDNNRRSHTCGEAIQYLGVNYNSMVVPCCHIRSDYPPHKDMLLGQVTSEPGSIFELYQGVIMPEDRYPCNVCMGKQWHPNHKIVFNEVREALKAERLNELLARNTSHG